MDQFISEECNKDICVFDPYNFNSKLNYLGPTNIKQVFPE
jgi:hypothetical protein